MYDTSDSASAVSRRALPYRSDNCGPMTVGDVYCMVLEQLLRKGTRFPEAVESATAAAKGYLVILAEPLPVPVVHPTPAERAEARADAKAVTDAEAARHGVRK